MSKIKEEIFSALFDVHYERLFNYSFKVVVEKDLSEELVQETFIKLWEHFDSINTNERSVESYLIITLKNKIIDYQRKYDTREKHTNIFLLHKEAEAEIDGAWDLAQQIEHVYKSLQPKTAEVFKLSREKGLTYMFVKAHGLHKLKIRVYTKF